MNKSVAKKMKQRSAGKPDIELGKRIRLRRVEQKISQAELGEQLGAISHIVSFWRYRFPTGSKCAVDAAELVAILHDFTTGFGEKMQPRSGIIKQPTVIDARRA